MISCPFFISHFFPCFSMSSWFRGSNFLHQTMKISNAVKIMKWKLKGKFDTQTASPHLPEKDVISWNPPKSSFLLHSAVKLQTEDVHLTSDTYRYWISTAVYHRKSQDQNLCMFIGNSQTTPYGSSHPIGPGFMKVKRKRRPESILRRGVFNFLRLSRFVFTTNRHL